MQSATLETAAKKCPRCGEALTDPDGMGWCQGCGYCKSLEEDKAKAVLNKAAQAKAPPPKALVAAQQAGKAAKNLLWLIILVIGAVGFVLMSQAAARALKADTFERALWTTLQIAGGLFLVFVAQFIGLMKVAPEEPSLSFKDMFVPFTLWGAIIKRLPGLHVPVWLAGWGVALIVSACVFIGGLGHWMTYMPGQKNAPGKNKKISF